MEFELQAKAKELVAAIREKHPPQAFPRIESERGALETLINAVQHGSIINASTISDKLEEFYKKHKQLDIAYLANQQPSELRKKLGIGPEERATAIVRIAEYAKDKHKGDIFSFVEDLKHPKNKLRIKGFGQKSRDLFLRDMGYLEYMPIDRYSIRFAERFGIARFYGIPNGLFLANGYKDVQKMWILFCKDAEIEPGIMDNINWRNGRYLGEKKGGNNICTTHKTRCDKCYLSKHCWTAYIKESKN